MEGWEWGSQQSQGKLLFQTEVPANTLCNLTLVDVFLMDDADCVINLPFFFFFLALATGSTEPNYSPNL